MDHADLIYDWNVAGTSPHRPAQSIQLADETLRDGLQGPSVATPSLDQMTAHLHNCTAVGIDAIDIGLPGAGAHVERQVEALAREIRDARLPLAPYCAARTLESDVVPIARTSQAIGIPIEAAVFIASSTIRMEVQRWDVDFLLRAVTQSITFAKREGLPVMFVTEDTVRASPDIVRALYGTALDLGADRLVVCDTTGHITPWGVRNLLAFILKIVAEKHATGRVTIDWHGHMDRGLGVINNIAALEAGADRLHGTALGIGERAGNAPLDLTIVNLQLMGWIDRDLRRLRDYVLDAAAMTGMAVPPNYPVFGTDAFETSTGVHADAVIKALRLGDPWLANRVYSGVPADDFGLSQKISVGPMSGESNVVYWLETHGVEVRPELVRRVLAAAKGSTRVLSDDEIKDVISSSGNMPLPDR